MPLDNLCHPYVGINPDLQAAEAWLNGQLARVRATGRFAEFITITPAIAQVMLMHNPANRSIVAAAVRRFVREMSAGQWHENGETIKIADTGELNDGQHRLTAVVEAGVPIYSLVAFGMARDSRRTVDRGTVKVPAHFLMMAGYKNAAVLASAMKIFLNLKNGVHTNAQRDNIEIEETLAAHPNFIENSAAPIAVARSFKVTQGLCIALHYMMAGHSKAKAAEFFETLHTGLGLMDASSPIQRLRSRLQANLGAKAKLPQMEVAALIIKAWNAYIEGRKLETLRWRTAGGAVEDFPQVRG